MHSYIKKKFADVPQVRVYIQKADQLREIADREKAALNSEVAVNQFTEGIKLLKFAAAAGTKFRAEAALKNGNNELAEELCTNALKAFKDPDLTSDGYGIYIMRAEVYIRLRQFVKALEDCQTLLAKYPDDPKAYLKIYEANLKLGNLQKAQEALHQAIDLGEKGLS